MYIANQQELIELYFESEKSCIAEYSGDINHDTMALADGIKDYAERFGLHTDFMDLFLYENDEDEEW